MDQHEIFERMRAITDSIDDLIDDLKEAAESGAPENDGLVDALTNARNAMNA